MSGDQSAPNTYLTQAASLRHARIPVTKLHKLVATGKVRTKADPGETVRYLVADLDTWLAEQQSLVNQPPST